MRKVLVNRRSLHAVGPWLVAAGLAWAAPLARAQDKNEDPAAAPADAATTVTTTTTTGTAPPAPTEAEIAAVPMIPVPDRSAPLPVEPLADVTPPPPPVPEAPPAPVVAERNSVAVLWIPTIRGDTRFDTTGGRGAADARGRNGFGAEFKVHALPLLFVTGAYRTITLDNVRFRNAQGQEVLSGNFVDDNRFQDIRAGLGVTAGKLPLYLRGEYVYNRQDANDSATGAREHDNTDGWSAFLGGAAALNRYLGVRGEAGWHDQRADGRGVEYRLGLDLFLYRNLSLTGDWRVGRRDNIRGDTADATVKIEEGVVGLRFLF